MGSLQGFRGEVNCKKMRGTKDGWIVNTSNLEEER